MDDRITLQVLGDIEEQLDSIHAIVVAASACEKNSVEPDYHTLGILKAIETISLNRGNINAAKSMLETATKA